MSAPAAKAGMAASTRLGMRKRAPASAPSTKALDAITPKIRESLVAAILWSSQRRARADGARAATCSGDGAADDDGHGDFSAQVHRDRGRVDRKHRRSGTAQKLEGRQTSAGAHHNLGPGAAATGVAIG
jgi:hypothetical protein